MALKTEKLAKIQAEVELGLETKGNIAKKYGINRTTLHRLIKKHGWSYGKSNASAAKSITAIAAGQVIDNEAKKLIDCTTKHLSQLDVIRSLTNANLTALMKALKKKKRIELKLSKEEIEEFFAFQKVLKISIQTLSIAYRDERTAMGIDNININQLQFVGEISEKDAAKVKELFDGITE